MITPRHSLIAVRRLALIGVAAFAGGCYSYTATSPARTAPGTRVAIDLTTRASADYSDRLGGTIDRIEGVLLSTTPDSARLQVERARLLGGGWSYWARETLTLPLAASASWQRRAFSRKRTVAAAAGLLLIGIQLFTGDLFGAFGHDPDPNPRPIPPVNPG